MPSNEGPQDASDAVIGNGRSGHSKPKPFPQISVALTATGLTGQLGLCCVLSPVVLLERPLWTPDGCTDVPQCPPWSQEAKERLGYPSHLLLRERLRPIPENVGQKWQRANSGLIQGALLRGFKPDGDCSLQVLFLCHPQIKLNKDDKVQVSYSNTGPDAEKPLFFFFILTQGHLDKDSG